MRRLLIRGVLPFCFCVAPPLVVFLVAAATPPAAMRFYWERVRDSHMDWLILGLGSLLFLVQMTLVWRALRWRGTTFDERGDRWLSNLAQAAEWFPMLGLIGTVGGILQTFSQISGQVPPERIIQLYAPAITATGSGLFMALANILPTWTVVIGRELLLALAGEPTTPAEEPPL